MSNKKPPASEYRWLKYVENYNYIKSKALANSVTLKGNTIEQYAPMGDFSTTKNTATEIKNNTQYKPVFFLVDSICK